MITDAFLRVSENQSVAMAAGDVVSTNSIPLGIVRDLAAGEDLAFVITVTTTLVGAGATLTCRVIAAENANLATGDELILASSAIYFVGDPQLTQDTANTGLGNSSPIILKFNPRLLNKQEISYGGTTTATLTYIGLRYSIGVQTTTAGAVTADLVKDIQGPKAFYPSGITVV